MPGEMIINANDIPVTNTPFGEPTDYPLDYNEPYFGLPNWYTILGFHLAVFSAATEVQTNSAGDPISFTTIFDGSFKLLTRSSDGNLIEIGSGTMPAFSHVSSFEEGDSLSIAGNGGYTLHIHEGAFADYLAGLDRVVFNGSEVSNFFEATYLGTSTVMDGGGGDDAFYGAIGYTNHISGGAGDDVIQGQGIEDILDGGDGNDSIIDGDQFNVIAYNSDTLIGGNGQDQLIGTGGNDRFFGGDGDDYLGQGGDEISDDTFDGGSGNDTIFGGRGFDTSIYHGTRAEYSITAGAPNGEYTVTGPDGTDYISGIEQLNFDDGTLIVGEENIPPVIQSDGGGETAFVLLNENTSAVTTVAATHPTGATIIYSIVGGDDATKFEIDSVTGALSFIDAPDFENPADVGSDNVYNVSVGAATQSGLSDIQDLTISVEDVFGNFVGDKGDNVLTGTDERDTITGLGGKDFLDGLGGDDFLYGGNGNDVLRGGDGYDRLDGGAGSDFLDGGAGIGHDTMVGGAGNDTYVVNAENDIVFEAPGEGTDTVRTSQYHYELGENVENLVYTGVEAFGGTGNELANTITGGPGIDDIDGGAGADRMMGMDGSDTYYVDDAGDRVIETPGGGEDVVETTLEAYTLPANVEDLFYIGPGAFNGTGNGLANLLSGFYGDDVLSGAGGDDILLGRGGADAVAGGAGNDQFIATSGDGDDSYFGNAGTDTYSLVATNANATIDMVAGTATSLDTGTDRLNSIENAVGGWGNDVFIANSVHNVFAGQFGNDSFVFGSVAAAGKGAARDVVSDFSSGDHIDFSAIDANGSQAGDPEFTFVGEITDVVDGLGRLGRGQIGFHYELDSNGISHTIVEGNINGDAAADFQVDIVAWTPLTEDLVL